MNQSRETIYPPHKLVFADKMCQALSLMSSWSCGGTKEHPRASGDSVMWQTHQSKENKFLWVRVLTCIAVRAHSRILWFWPPCSVLLLSFVFCCLFIFFKFPSFGFQFLYWGLICLPTAHSSLIHRLMDFYICAYSPDHPDQDTQYSSSLEVESLFWIKEIFLTQGTLL